MNAEINWVYPQTGYQTYSAQLFVIGSASPKVDVLSLNGEALTLHENPNANEKAFAQVIELSPGENRLELQPNHGEPVTRLIHRLPAWQMPEGVLALPVQPNPDTRPALRHGETLAVRIHTGPGIQRVWLQLLDASGLMLAEYPLFNTATLQCDAHAESHGTRVSIFGELYHDEGHPPLAPAVQSFEAQVPLVQPTLSTLPDGTTLSLHYLLEDEAGQLLSLDGEQRVTLWQVSRSLEISGESRALYAGAMEGQRLPLLPPEGSVFEVLAQADEATYLLAGQDSGARLKLLGGGPLSQVGSPLLQSLESVSITEDERAIETHFKLRQRCGVLTKLQPETGLAITLLGVAATLNHQCYQGEGNHGSRFWRVMDQGRNASTLTLPFVAGENISAFRGVETVWEADGLHVSLLKRAQTLEAACILIDPGHGGAEHGTTALDGTPEKRWALAFATRLKERLEAEGVGQVVLTRETDTLLSLEDRASIVAATEADICLSLHANALPDGEDPLARRGVSTHTYSPWSVALGDALHKALTRGEQARPDDGRWQSNFAMTRLATAQSALLELGYFIHPEEYAELLDEAVQDQLIEAILSGLQAYFS